MRTIMEVKMQVPFLSILFMAVSAVICIGLPIALFVFFRKKFDSKTIPMIAGILAFIIFALVLESLVHSFVIGKIIIKEKSPALYIIYAVLMAGIFEETARLIAYKILKRKYSGIGTGLAYGAGHGGIESVLLAGLSLVFAIVISVMVNTGSIGIITGRMSGNTLLSINNQIEVFRATAPYLFLVSGLERLSAIAIQIGLSVIMFYAVYGERKLWLYPAAVLLHAIIDTPAASMQAGVINNIPLVEALAVLCAALSLFLAWLLHRKFGNV